MKKLTKILSIALITGALFSAVPVRAQNADNAAGTQSGVTEIDDENEGTDWGWIGLLGLIGLYGLKGKDDKRHTNTTVNR